MKNNKLHIGVIGASGMGQSHMKGIVNHKDAVLEAICDIDTTALEQAALKFNISKAKTDYRDIISDSAIDAVVIVTPDQLHLEMVTAALNAGKHVLCEKPMALTTEQCEQMLLCQKQSSCQLMVGQVCRYTPGFLKAKELIEKGLIGELFFVESEYAHNYENARGEDDWRVTPLRDGFIGGGCHAVDLLRWIAGDPDEVFAYANHKCLKDWPTNDCTAALYQFPNGVIGKVFVSTGCRRDYTMRSVFYGTAGTIVCDNTSPDITLFTTSLSVAGEKSAYTTAHKIKVSIESHNVSAEINGFVNALINNEPVPVSALEGAKTVAVCEASISSAQKGMPVKIKYPGF